MEGKNGKAVVVVGMVTVMFIGQATARFDKCYAACYFECIIDARRLMPYVPKKFLPCAWKCLKKCMFHPAENHLYYCNLGCSMDFCSDFVDDAMKMEGCVDRCSNKDCNIKH